VLLVLISQGAVVGMTELFENISSFKLAHKSVAMTTGSSKQKGQAQCLWIWPKSDNGSKLATPFILAIPPALGEYNKRLLFGWQSQQQQQQKQHQKPSTTAIDKCPRCSPSISPQKPLSPFFAETHLTNVIVHLLLGWNGNHWMLIQWFLIVITVSRCDTICILALPGVQRSRLGCRIASRSGKFLEVLMN